MNCKLSGEYIMKFFDGDLNDIENSHLQRHLKACERCKREFESMKEIFDSLGQTNVIEPPEDFEERVMEKIYSMEMTNKSKSELSFAFLYTGVAFILMIALVIINEVLRYVDFHEVVLKFGTVADFLPMLLNAARNFLVFVSGIQKGLHQAAAAVADSFSFVFQISAGILLMIYGVLTRRAKQTNGGAR